MPALLVAVIAGAAFCADAPAPLDPKINKGILPATYRNLPLMWIPKLKDPAKFDGSASDPVWNDAATYDLREVVSREPLKQKTQFLVFCTDTTLYLAFRCTEPKMGELQANEGEIWSRDGVEIFLEPYNNTLQKPYHHLMIDAAGHYEAARYHVYQRLKNFPKLSEKDWKPKIEIQSGKGNGQWTLEIRLPFDQMVLSDDAKAKKTLWRLNAYRSRPQKSNNEAHMAGAWSPPGVMMFHSAGKFGYALPEAYATAEFIEQVKATAGPVKIEEKPADPAEIDKRLGELASADFDTRLAASDRLKQIADAGPTMFDAVKGKLEAVVKDVKAVEHYAMAKDTLDDLKNTAARLADDDPPPFGFE